MQILLHDQSEINTLIKRSDGNKKKSYEKRFTKSLAPLFLAALLTGCGSATGQAPVSGNPPSAPGAESTAEAAPAAEKKEYYDENFLADFSEAIQARWTLNDAQAEDNAADSKQFLMDCIDAELNIIGPKDYRNKKFKDSHLYEDALVYLNALEDSKKLVESMPDDLAGLGTDEKWDELAQKRYALIVDLYDNYDLKIDSKHTKSINKVHNEYYINKYGTDGFDRLLNTIGDSYAVKDAQRNESQAFDIVNRTPYDFKDLTLTAIALKLNKSTNQYDYVDSISEKNIAEWKAGETITYKLDPDRVEEIGRNNFDAVYFVWS